MDTEAGGTIRCDIHDLTALESLEEMVDPLAPFDLALYNLHVESDISLQFKLQERLLRGPGWLARPQWAVCVIGVEFLGWGKLVFLQERLFLWTTSLLASSTGCRQSQRRSESPALQISGTGAVGSAYEGVMLLRARRLFEFSQSWS